MSTELPLAGTTVKAGKKPPATVEFFMPSTAEVIEEPLLETAAAVALKDPSAETTTDELTSASTKDGVTGMEEVLPVCVETTYVEVEENTLYPSTVEHIATSTDQKSRCASTNLPAGEVTTGRLPATTAEHTVGAVGGVVVGVTDVAATVVEGVSVTVDQEPTRQVAKKGVIHVDIQNEALFVNLEDSVGDAGPTVNAPRLDKTVGTGSAAVAEKMSTAVGMDPGVPMEEKNMAVVIETTEVGPVMAVTREDGAGPKYDEPVVVDEKEDTASVLEVPDEDTGRTVDASLTDLIDGTSSVVVAKKLPALAGDEPIGVFIEEDELVTVPVKEGKIESVPSTTGAEGEVEGDKGSIIAAVAGQKKEIDAEATESFHTVKKDVTPVVDGRVAAILTAAPEIEPDAIDTAAKELYLGEKEGGVVVISPEYPKGAAITTREASLTDATVDNDTIFVLDKLPAPVLAGPVGVHVEVDEPTAAAVELDEVGEVKSVLSVTAEDEPFGETKEPVDVASAVYKEEAPSEVAQYTPMFHTNEEGSVPSIEVLVAAIVTAATEAESESIETAIEQIVSDAGEETRVEVKGCPNIGKLAPITEDKPMIAEPIEVGVVEPVMLVTEVERKVKENEDFEVVAEEILTSVMDEPLTVPIGEDEPTAAAVQMGNFESILSPNEEVASVKDDEKAVAVISTRQKEKYAVKATESRPTPAAVEDISPPGVIDVTASALIAVASKETLDAIETVDEELSSDDTEDVLLTMSKTVYCEHAASTSTEDEAEAHAAEPVANTFTKPLVPSDKEASCAVAEKPSSVVAAKRAPMAGAVHAEAEGYVVVVEEEKAPKTEVDVAGTAVPWEGDVSTEDTGIEDQSLVVEDAEAIRVVEAKIDEPASGVVEEPAASPVVEVSLIATAFGVCHCRGLACL